MPSSAPTERERAVVAGLQWGLTQAFVLGSLATLLDDYYRATTSRLFPPDWVFSVVAAVPLAFAIGGVMGYRWVANGQATSGSRAHRARVTFTGTVLVGWALAIVPRIGMRAVLGDRLHTAPWFLLPSLVPVVVLGGAAYRDIEETATGTATIESVCSAPFRVRSPGSSLESFSSRSLARISPRH